MKTLTRLAEMRAAAADLRAQGKRIGLVPTLGALHEGHLSLVRRSKQQADATVVSIFVNPTQFGPGEDFQRYPRNLEPDTELLGPLGVDFLFTPAAEEMYPPDFQTFVTVDGVDAPLEGQSRPGHFRGVATVVLKLFQIVQPDIAWFGRKDAQQCAVVHQLLRDLNLPVAIEVCPIVREPDGLAMSSRNAYLRTEERSAARVLFLSLCQARDLIAGGEHRSEHIVARMRQLIAGEPRARIDYIEVVDPNRFTPKTSVAGRSLIALAVRVGGTRLIDNLLVEEHSGRLAFDL